MTRRTALLAAFAVAFVYAVLWADAADAPNRVVSDLTLPDGDVVLMAPLVVQDVDGVTVRGGVKTRLIYRGPPTPGIIQVVRGFRCTLANFEILTDVPGVDAAVLLSDTADSNQMTGRVSSGAMVKNVVVSHDGKHQPKRAFAVDSFALGGTDHNNDHHTFQDCVAKAYTEAGYYVNGTQCHQITYTRCGAVQYPAELKRKAYGWHFTKGVFFTARDCAANSNAVDIVTGSAAISARVENFNSEHSQQLFRTDDRAYAEAQYSLDGVRWDGEPKADRPAIDAWGRGPFFFRNVSLGGINGVCPTVRFTGPLGHDGPLPGTADITGVILTQYQGTPADVKTLVTTPKGWDVRAFALSWLYVTPTDGRERMKVSIAGYK